MKYAYCPVCGHKLLEGNEPSNVKVKCSKCKTIIAVRIAHDGVGVVPAKNQNEQ